MFKNLSVEMKLLLLLVSVLSREVAAVCVSNCNCGATNALCCMEIYEEQPPQTIIGNDYIIDDGFTYDFQANNFFAINQSNGVISTLITIDREAEYPPDVITGSQHLMDNNYCFNLAIREIGGSRLILVDIKVLDVNDNGPIFTPSQYSFSIFEGTSSDDIVPKECDQQRIVTLSATDIDEEPNAMVIYRVEDSVLFELADSRIPCVQTKAGVELDRDNPPSRYSFTLVAEDANNSSLATSEANVTYVLLDLNDNRPFFTNSTLTLSIREDLKPGAFIYQFQARDADIGMNGQMSLRYRLEDNTAGSMHAFTINATSGDLTLAQKVDAEGSTSSYDLMVFATDMGVPSLTGSIQVRIDVEDVNEHSVIEPFDDLISIEEGNGYEMLTVVRFEVYDSDSKANVGNTLRITSGPEQFYLTKQSIPNSPLDLYSVKFNGNLDFERDQTIELVFNLTEEGDPILYQLFSYNISVTDKNDNAPALNITELIIEEEELLNISLDQYTYDPDRGENGTIAQYELVSVSNESGHNVTNMFRSLLSANGLLNVHRSIIDREVVGNLLTFEINITDAGSPPQSKLSNFTVTVTDKNDNSPFFSPSSYNFNFSEGQRIGSSVGQVKAMDLDSGENGIVNFAIVPPSPYFVINLTTGVISSKVVFDRESNVSRYMINIVASDRGTPPTQAATMLVPIMITDINDNNPVFVSDMETFEIDTNFSPEEIVGQVVAVDEDASSRNSLTWYQIQRGPNSSIFSIRNNTSGIITLETTLSEGNYTLNISAFNPGEEESGDSILVTVLVIRATSYITLIGIGAACGGLLIVITCVSIFVICLCLRNKKSKDLYQMNETRPNFDKQNSILKIPAINGSLGRNGRVTFNDRVEETHYDEKSFINSMKKTVRTQSVTKFDNSPRSSHSFVGSDNTLPSPSSPTSQSCLSGGQPDSVVVEDLKVSPRNGMNGNIGNHCQYDVHSHPHSPIMHISNDNSGRCGRDMIDYSQGTSSDGHTSNNDVDDEESMYSDDASIVNTALSRFGNNRSNLDMPYETPSTNSHLDLHRHLPPISHGQDMHSSSLAQLHAHNLAQLAKSNGNGTRPQYNSLLNSTHDHSLNLTHDHSLNLTHTHESLQHASLSPQRSRLTHSPPEAINHMEVMPSTKHHHMVGQNLLVMPDAFPRDAPEIHRFPIDTYADYGETSTYASTELDDALMFPLDAEPHNISLTATDYEDTEL